MAVLCGLPLLAWFVIPESPRWLIERNQAKRCQSDWHSIDDNCVDRTKALLEKMAKDNKKDLPLPRLSLLKSHLI